MTHTQSSVVKTGAVDHELRVLEGRLLGHSAVRDCVVARRANRAGVEAIVAYVVGEAAISLDTLQQHARAAGSAILPDRLVRISSVPLRDSGDVDSDALDAIAVIDAPTVDRLRDAVRASSPGDDSEIVIDWKIPIDSELRIDDLVAARVRASGTRSDTVQAAQGSAPDNRLSLSIGPELIWPANSPTRLADLLARAAERFPERTVTCVELDGEHVMTYPELLERAERIMTGLRAVGLKPRDPVIFQFERNPDFIAAFWGCMLGGFLPAALSVPPANAANASAAIKLKNTWELLRHPVILTTAELRPHLNRLAKSLDTDAMRIVTLEETEQGPRRESWDEPGMDDVALLLLTSGSTGVPKAVTQTHRALIAHVTATPQTYGFTSDDVGLNWLPLDHVGGIVMSHLRDVSLGCNQIQVRADYILEDALRLLDLIERFKATSVWGPNFSYALINDRTEELATRRWDLSSMRCILNGGEAIVSATTRRFMKRLTRHGLPETAMRPIWGMSETSSGATDSLPFRPESTSDDDEFVEVGGPHPGFEIRIVDDEERIVAEGIEGCLEVRGVCVTRGYFNNPEVTAAAFTDDGWFRTGDVGRLVDGRLTITGRAKGEIIVNGVNYSAHEVEAAVESVSGVTASFAAAFPVREAGANTDSLAIAFHTDHEADEALVDLLRRVRVSVKERVGIAPRFLLPVARASIPKTGIGKILRATLTKQFAAGELEAVVRRSERLTQQAQTIPNWFFRRVWCRRAVMTQRPLDADSTVVIVAGDDGIGESIARQARSSGAKIIIARHRNEIGRVVHQAPASDRVIVLLGDRPAPDDASTVSTMALDAVSSLVDVVRAIAAARPDKHTELVVYERGTQQVIAGDRIDLVSAAALGILRTIPAEHPELSVRHIDLSATSADAAANLINRELADRTSETEVAYRNGERWVARLAQHPAVPSPRGHVFGAAPGFYVVTGGLGGLGFEISRQLLSSADVPLLLVGRRTIAGDGDPRSTALDALQALGTVHFEALDVADGVALTAAVTAAAARWARPLAGVIHLAGVFEPRLLADETRETLTAALRAKVDGAWNIHQLLLQWPNAVLVAFSSVNGELGGYSAGAYAAGNAFIDGLVRHHVDELGRAAYSLGWSLWDSIGMSRDYPQQSLAARRGYRIVSLQQGKVSLTAAVGGEPGHLLIGLDATNLHVRRHIGVAPVSDGAMVYRARRDTTTASTSLVVQDEFGVVVPFEQRDVSADELALIRSRGHGSSSGAAVDAAFGNDLERTIAKVWRETLSVTHVGENDNFFDIGGTSLLAATTSRKLRQALGRDVATIDIYRFPTLRLLAQYYNGGATADAVELDDSEERGRARRAQRARRRPASRDD